MNNLPTDSDLYRAKRSEALHKYEMYVNMNITFCLSHLTQLYILLHSLLTSYFIGFFQFGWFGETSFHPFPSATAYKQVNL